MPKTRRKKVPQETRLLVLLEAGYKCANPSCRHILTLELHHIVWVKDQGTNEVQNLLVLCSNCHGLHTKGHIPAEAIAAWKGLLIALNSPHRSAADFLLVLNEEDERVKNAPDPEKVAPPFRFTGDSLGHLSGLMTSGLVAITRRYSGAGTGGPTFEVGLTDRGRNLLKAWKSGRLSEVQEALGFSESPDDDEE